MDVAQALVKMLRRAFDSIRLQKKNFEIKIAEKARRNLNVVVGLLVTYII